VTDDGLAAPLGAGVLETELKLSATSAEPLRRLASMPRLGSIRLGEARTFLELDRYLDTDDGRLSSSQWACRLRRRSRRYLVSLKGPPAKSRAGAPCSRELGGVGAALHRRPEIEGPATARLDPDSWPPSAARSRLLSLAGGRDLHEVFALRQRRTQRPVTERRAQVATLSLDRVLVLHRGTTLGGLWCVEVELDAAAARREARAQAALLDGLLTELLAVEGLSVEPLTKLERAMTLLDHAAH